MDITAERRDLAAAFRWAARFGLNEGVCNHFSVDMGEGRFLVNPFGMHWSEIRASDVILVDDEGAVLEGDGELEETAFFIHRAIHQACPQARCVMHTHMPYATALTCLEDGRLLPIHQTAIRFVDRTAYDDEYGGLALDAGEGERIASKMGNNSVLFLAHHGVVTTGRTVAIAFDDLYYLERVAELQVLATSTGRPLKLVDEAAVRHTLEQYGKGNEDYGEAHFAALKRILDREEPEYAQ